VCSSPRKRTKRKPNQPPAQLAGASASRGYIDTITLYIVEHSAGGEPTGTLDHRCLLETKVARHAPGKELLGSSEYFCRKFLSKANSGSSGDCG
jgi:hypothetical protein